MGSKYKQVSDALYGTIDQNLEFLKILTASN
jgi:hypothetical protein